MTSRGRFYGLSLDSSRPIPGGRFRSSTVGAPPPDVLVHWGAPYPDQPEDWVPFYVSDETDDTGQAMFRIEHGGPSSGPLRLSYADGTTFWIRKGHPNHADEIWATWPDSLTSEDASTYFLGPVLGYVLRMHGQVVLHASAVGVAPWHDSASTDEGVIALVGPAGAGKSTTAAAFALRGHSVLTEDVCALREPATAGAPFDVLPGYPLIRLWEESVEMLYGSVDALPRLTPTWDKRYLPLDESGTEAFHERPQPLRAIVLLGAREASDAAPRAEPVPPAEAFIELVANTYRNLVLDREQRVDEFRGLHRLLQTTPVWRIIPHTDPERLDALLDVILATTSKPRE